MAYCISTLACSVPTQPCALLQIILNSMHRYQPRVHLILRKEGQGGTINDLEGQDYKTFIFPETVFTAVTAYQNQLVSWGRWMTSNKL